MKKYFRKIFGYIIISPFAISTKLLSIFMGPQKAVNVIGPIATQVAKQLLKFWVPKIDTAEDFDLFLSRMKKNLRLWKPFYDIEVSEESNDVFRLYVANCPFCEALNRLGLSKLSAHICKGDWAIAQDNPDKWIFERDHQIGTGDSYCDHTYKRIN